jgi:predicted patatin/cPLA2 family phospholipase
MRAASKSQPGRRADPYKVGLAIEGGGMRAVISAAMVAGLERLGLRNAFDAVYGSSAGACAERTSCRAKRRPVCVCITT